MSSVSPFAKFNTAPKAHGLYDPSRDRDACGLAMVATLRGSAGHDIIETALNALRNLDHRGAIGSDAGTGDGAGILSQIPDGFFRAVVDFKLPAKGQYGAGLVFIDSDDAIRIESAFAPEGYRLARRSGSSGASRRSCTPRYATYSSSICCF